MILLQFLSICGSAKYDTLPWQQPGFFSSGVLWYSFLNLLGYLSVGLIGTILVIVSLIPACHSSRKHRPATASSPLPGPSVADNDDQGKKSSPRETIYLMEADDGSTVRVPESKLDSWAEAQERHKAGDSHKLTKQELELQNRLVAALLSDEDIPLISAPPPSQDSTPESSLDLLAQLQDECEQEQASIVSSGSAGPPKRAILSLSCACVASLIACSVLGYLAWSNHNRVQTLVAELQSVTAAYQSLDIDLTNAKIESALLDDYIDSISPEYIFYHNNAVIVTYDGKEYHRYGCPSTTYRRCLVLDRDSAPISYDPCPDCCAVEALRAKYGSGTDAG